MNADRPEGLVEGSGRRLEPRRLQNDFCRNERGRTGGLLEHLQKALCRSELPQSDQRGRSSHVGVIAREREAFRERLVELGLR